MKTSKPRHVNIPIFIPHLGCPNNCVFCNQRYISGVVEFDMASVIPEIEKSLSTVNPEDEVEIAFFGGSFTGIDRALMLSLLEIAKNYLDSGRVKKIRCSTRPDYINPEIIDILLKYGMTTVELGLQSSSDKVLSATGRGHSRQDEINACRLIKASGLRLGGQMMIGLPESTLEDELECARFIADMGCDEARIYPTVVFKNTELCEMTKRGEYLPLTVEAAAERSASALEVLMSRGVNILRIGLCESENLRGDETYFAGPNHAALGELVYNEFYYNIIKKSIDKSDLTNKRLTVFIPINHLSRAVGQRKRNKNRILREYGCSEVLFKECLDLSEYTVLLNIEERK